MRQTRQQTIAARRKGEYLFFEGALKGKTLTLLVDSGANAHAFNLKTMAALALLPASSKTLQGDGAGARVTMQTFPLQGLTLGRATLASTTAVAVPFPEELTADGVLGYPLFAEYVVTLNHRNPVLTLTPHGTFVPPKNAVALPLRLRNGFALVEVTVDGQRAWLEIDTGDGGSLTFNAPFVRKKRRIEAYPKALVLPTGKGVGGVTYGRVARTKELRLGPFTLPQPLLNLAESKEGAESDEKVDGRIGMEILSRFTTHLDYRRQKLYLEPTANLKAPFPFSRTGLFVHRKDGKYRVLTVLPNSPATEAGIVEDEEVLEIAGKATRTLDAFALQAIVRQPVGTRLMLLLRRSASESPRQITLTLRDLL